MPPLARVHEFCLQAPPACQRGSNLLPLLFSHASVVAGKFLAKGSGGGPTPPPAVAPWRGAKGHVGAACTGESPLHIVQEREAKLLPEPQRDNH